VTKATSHPRQTIKLLGLEVCAPQSPPSLQTNPVIAGLVFLLSIKNEKKQYIICLEASILMTITRKKTFNKMLS